jgi:hypothetical protein
MGARSQRHMQDLPSIYPNDSDGNAAPVLATDITSKSTTTTVNVSVATNFTGETSYSAENLPEGCSINASTGAITGTSSAGSYQNVRVFASNAYGVVHTSKFTWTVT